MKLASPETWLSPTCVSNGLFTSGLAQSPRLWSRASQVSRSTVLSLPLANRWLLKKSGHLFCEMSLFLMWLIASAPFK